MGDKKTIRQTTVLFTSFVLLVTGLVYFGLPHNHKSELNYNKLTWLSFKHFFISESGRVIRPDNDNDTVSEAMAYAMLRAVWVDDQEVFNKLYAWSEKELSRYKLYGDHLLSWHWNDNKVLDAMPASDADIDYALGLLLAEKKWGNMATPPGLESYGRKARHLLDDILRLETVKAGDHLVLLPWLKSNPTDKQIINPSYFSPAHFRTFYQITNDQRWLDLIESSYLILNKVAEKVGTHQGAGLIPDWVEINLRDLTPLPPDTHSFDFGWEAVRVPFRVYLDAYWFNSTEAHDFLRQHIGRFVQSEYNKRGTIFAEYKYDGTTDNPYHSALYFMAYALAVKDIDVILYEKMLKLNKECLRLIDGYYVYEDSRNYYVNALAWLVLGFHDEIITGMISPSM
jgi:endoglucanase